MGAIVDQRGRIVGRHQGQHGFTVGQRRGIGVSTGTPLYVLGKDAVSNRVIVGPRAALHARSVTLRAVKLHRSGERVDRVKLRYRSVPLRARLPGGTSAGHHESLEIEVLDGVDGAAPGQLACLMDGELIVGWGTISGR